MDSGATEREILEKKLQDPTAEPIFLPLEFLKFITCNFSTERELGRGAYGVVYKGVLQSGKVIAVKKLFDTHLLDNKNQFENEITCLMEVRHQNVVQLVGYCVETRSEAMKLPSGKHVMVQQPACLLCFEYHCKGSLDKHVSDDFSVLDWDMRYEIISGVCRGLHYLHEECHIVHLDLKPQNILMDATMMPKIADFGLSRLLGEQKSKTVTVNFAGTLGYMAQEYIDHGIISSKADIFSLGVIIIEIITGHRDYPNFGERTETSLKRYTEKVVGSWRNRLEITPIHISPEIHIQQVEQCISIALKCLDPDSKKRPTSLDIVQSLNAVEAKCWSVGSTTSVTEKTGDDIKSRIVIIPREHGHIDVTSIDVHPTNPWILTNHYSGSVLIWDYHLQELIYSSDAREQETAWTSKFIARAGWFLVGFYFGHIEVYSCDTLDKVKKFKAHDTGVWSLSIHPTEPYVLSSSCDGEIKLWDWEKGWKCIRKFVEKSPVCQVKFNPKDANSFVSVSRKDQAKIWNIGSLRSESTLFEIQDAKYLDFFCQGGQLLLIIGHSNKETASIWDYHRGTCVETLQGHTESVSAACFHPDIPILVTGSYDGTVRMWNSSNFRLEGVLIWGLGQVKAIECLRGTRRIVIGHKDGLAIAEIYHDQRVAFM